MSSTLHVAQSPVAGCYSILSASPLAGIEDYSDGIYRGIRALPYPEAQRCQHDYLLDQLGVRRGFRLLDVGCGTGSLLLRAVARGALAVGVTISAEQVSLAKARALDVRLASYLDLERLFGPEFDGIVANGSIEHFCQPELAAAGWQDATYRRMFAVFNAVLRPDSASRRVVTTTIHFRGRPLDPRKMLRSPFSQWRDDVAFHMAILHRGYGGYYPAPGQLARCATPYFRLIAEEDGTEDYLFTSEDWRARLAQGLRRSPALRRHIARCVRRQPAQTAFLLLSFFGAQSWIWQFRGEPAPMVLYRQTWSAP